MLYRSTTSVTSAKNAPGWTWAVFLVISLFLILALFSYDPKDLSFFTTNVNDPPRNYGGVLGSYLGFFLFMTFGAASFLMPVIGFMIGGSMLIYKTPPHVWKKSAMGMLFVALSSLLLSTDSFLSSEFLWAGLKQRLNIPSAGGLVGQRVARDLLDTFIGSEGTLLVLLPLWILAGVLFFDIPWKRLFEAARQGLLKLPSLFAHRTRRISTGKERPVLEMPRLLKRESAKQEDADDDDRPVMWKKPQPVLHIGPLQALKAKAKPKPKEAPVRQVAPKRAGAYQLPTLQLLDEPREVGEKEIHEDLQQNAKILEATLRDFGIDADVVEVHRGPVITRYELQPAPGVKVNRITALSDDIALAMKAASIRIVAPIPGKAAVGIEVPNSKSAMVTLKELLVSEEFETSRAKIPLALGKDVSGKPIVTDLTDMPHMLIAGATGSGKTVCVNSVILSILYTLTPDQCKLLLVDPKMVELANYRDLPHLIGPVVTDPKRVSGALHYAVREMEKRYKLLAEVGVRNIEGFNTRPNKEEVRARAQAQEQAEGKEAEEQEPIPATLPYIVIIIDELADLMMIAPVDIESAITRLAQLSRAVGIHMILATQRPSVDVITGVIKANFPARISFQVASKVDSRTILDANGADKLLGKGDLLFLPPGSSKLVRAQGTWLSDPEIHRVISFIKEQGGSQNFNTEIFEAPKKSALGDVLAEEDELYDEAVEIVLATQQASASILQRRLRVGYARAARLVDMMEERGIVGAFKGSKARDILVRAPGMPGREEA